MAVTVREVKLRACRSAMADGRKERLAELRRRGESSGMGRNVPDHVLRDRISGFSMMVDQSYFTVKALAACARILADGDVEILKILEDRSDE